MFFDSRNAIGLEDNIVALKNNSYLIIHNEEIELYNSNNELLNNISFNTKIIDYSLGNICRNKVDYLVILTGDREDAGKDIIIFSLDEEIKELYRKDFSELKPWKVTLGDIDGNGIKEVSIGVYKEAIFHKVMDKRPFIYTYKDNNLQPVWKGSRLSKPFTDYLFFDIDGDSIDEIIAIEILEDSKKVINTYKWKGFGFEGLVESGSYEDLEKLRIEKGSVYIDIKEGKDVYSGLLKYEDDNLIIERVGSN